jgi:hypothetical protein
MIITDSLAKKFAYFTVVEDGTMIAENLNGLPEAPRIDKPIITFDDYNRAHSKIKNVYKVDRLDPLTLGGFERLGPNVGNMFAKHSGELYLIGPPKKRERKITLAQREEGDETLNIEYLSQDYQIVRQTDLKVADKILDRGGLKGIVSDIVPDLGKDEKGKPYELVVNPDEVWREDNKDKDKDKGQIESRLDFLARMYESKKGKPEDGEEPAAETTTEEKPDDD